MQAQWTMRIRSDNHFKLVINRKTNTTNVDAFMQYFTMIKDRPNSDLT